MTWRLEWSGAARRALKGFDRPVSARLVAFLEERIAGDEDPRRIGEALHGEKAELWRYRVGDYRIVCQIEDARVTVLVVTIGHRKDVYR